MKMYIRILLVTLMVFSMTVVGTWALTAEESKWVESNIVAGADGNLVFKAPWLSTWVTTDASAAGTTPVTIGTIGGVPVFLLDGKTEEAFVKQIGTRVNNDSAIDRIDEITNNMAMQADVSGALTMFSGAFPLFRLIVGVIIVAVLVLFAFHSGSDMLYLASPVFRNKREMEKATGEGSHVKQGADGQVHYRWITDEAVKAVQKAAIDDSNVWLNYLKTRVWAYIAAGIAIYIFFFGDLGMLLKVAINVVKGFMDVLSTLGG